MFLKKLVPHKIKVKIKLYALVVYDFKRFLKYSSINQTFDTENKLKGKLTIYYHVIEKGLTMPETRIGFGQPVVLELISMMNKYIAKNYNTKSLEFVHSLNVLNEFLAFHEQNKFALNSNIIDGIDFLNTRIETFETSKQLEFTRENFFKESESSFDKFCLTRYSSRSYSDREIPLEILNNCIRLALKSPTSCNRQVNRIYVIRDSSIKKEVLNLQYGNRGFGHLADTLFIISADISVFQGPNDRNESYVNSGMFAMSLIYALHRFKIGSCPLNWSVEKSRDMKLRKLLNIPDNERVGLVISCGYLPELIRIASSPRLDIQEITKFF
jgi:nitroreductase